MDATRSVERFIAGKRADAGHGHAAAHHAPGTLPFVTISRQSGAGGRALAQTVIERLDADRGGEPLLEGWRLFDRGMCEALLANENLREPLDELLDEDYHSQITEFVRGLFGRHAIQGVAFPQLARLLHTVASVGKVVIVGYGGFQATRELPGGIDLRLVASSASRARRMAPLLGESEAATARLIGKRDAEQRRLLRTHYRVDADDPELYDMVFNTDRVPLDTVADFLVGLIRQRIAALASAAPERVGSSVAGSSA